MDAHQQSLLTTSRPRRSRIRPVLVIALLMLSACGGDGGGAGNGAEGSGGSEQVPTSYTGQFLQIREGQPGQGGEVVLGAKLTAEDGTKANIEFTYTDAPPGEGGSVECGGQTYEAEAVLDQSDTAAGTLTIAGHGTADLEVERNVGVLAAPGPPVCDEWGGTWTGTGDLQGESGTFSWVGFHEEERIEGSLTLEQD